MISHEDFADSMPAKRFLISRIVAEAHRQNDDLPELEEKMLYFSESFPTLPGMQEIAEKFAASGSSLTMRFQCHGMIARRQEVTRTVRPALRSSERGAIRLESLIIPAALCFVEAAKWPRHGFDVVGSSAV